MTPDEIAAMAERAASAAARCRDKDGGILGAIGAPGRLGHAAAYVRAHPEAPAEALFLELRDHCPDMRGLLWGEIEARKRAGLELFRAAIVLLDHGQRDGWLLTAAEIEAANVAARAACAASAARGAGLERTIERGPAFGARIWDE